VGFADGMVREMQVNLGQDAAGGAGLARLFEAAGGGEGSEAPGLSASSSLRPLRECKDMMGECITCIRQEGS